MKNSVSISQCDEIYCSEVAPAYCGDCGSTFCLTHAEKHNCDDDESDLQSEYSPEDS